MKKAQVISITKNYTGNEKCWVCNNDGYIVVDWMIYHCDCCEVGSMNDDSTTTAELVSEHFDPEDLIDRNKYYAKNA